MKETLVHRVREMTLENPIMVEGLPGVGHVGKLVADHLVEELQAEKIIEIYSPHFPPQVMVKKDGTIRQVRNEIYARQGRMVSRICSSLSATTRVPPTRGTMS